MVLSLPAKFGPCLWLVKDRLERYRRCISDSIPRLEVASDADLVKSTVTQATQDPQTRVTLVAFPFEEKSCSSKCDTCSWPGSPRKNCYGIRSLLVPRSGSASCRSIASPAKRLFSAFGGRKDPATRGVTPGQVSFHPWLISWSTPPPHGLIRKCCIYGQEVQSREYGLAAAPVGRFSHPKPNRCRSVEIERYSSACAG
jgi:hypothetical protein